MRRGDGFVFGDGAEGEVSLFVLEHFERVGMELARDVETPERVDWAGFWDEDPPNFGFRKPLSALAIFRSIRLNGRRLDGARTRWRSKRRVDIRRYRLKMSPHERRWKPLGTNQPAETVRQEAESKEAESRAQEREWSRVLSRLEQLEVTPATRELFARFTKGELSLRQLDAALNAHRPSGSLTGRPRESGGKFGLKQRTLFALWAVLAALCSVVLLLPRWQRSGWPEAPATVVKLQSSPRQVVATVEFSSPAGPRIGLAKLGRLEGTYAQGGGYSAGKPVRIRFNPDNESETEIVGWGPWEVPVVIAGVLTWLLWKVMEVAPH